MERLSWLSEGKNSVRSSESSLDADAQEETLLHAGDALPQCSMLLWFDDEESPEEEVERGFHRLRMARERAEDIVRERGWSETYEDFEIQVEEEAKRQWEEEMEREMDANIEPNAWQCYLGSPDDNDND